VFYADLHIHSRHSRATSADCDLEHLALWAQRKGIGVVGTGDFTHPVWRDELGARLVPDAPGLFRLRDDLARAVEDELPAACRAPVRFMLSVEISTIYKHGDRTRKIHHLVYAPSLDAADRIRRRLARIGNLASDGRPILGLDSRDLLEIVLEADDGAYLVPAHVWTPWFAVLGSKAGFDAVEDCYRDLAKHVFALETGLSSDPAMNWRLSKLDRYRLVSNSDAHSPGKLGREATRFDCAPDYFAIRRALETGDGFGGTVEFFPEEGKYHLDGHRKCGVRQEPSATRARGTACPSCGDALTVGVLNRVEELADRPEGARPDGAAPFRNLVPLPEVLGELLGVGASSGAVQKSYQRLLAKLGPELPLLEQAAVEEVERGMPLLGEAVARMREGRVRREAGYDGEYGVIRLFTAAELRRRAAVGSLFGDEDSDPDPVPVGSEPDPEPDPEPVSDFVPVPVSDFVSANAPAPAPQLSLASDLLGALDDEQRAAATATGGPLLIIAGPGTGKTRTLTHRIAHLVRDLGVAADECLAITFTRRAAGELRERLAQLLPTESERVTVATFHSLALALLRERAADAGLPEDFRILDQRERVSLAARAFSVDERAAERLLARIGRGEVPDKAAAWARALRDAGVLDLDGLVARAVELGEARADVAASWRARFRRVSVDEYQDVDENQYRFVRLLAPSDGDVCAIGDPDQAIYGFRGADVRFFLRFQEDFPSARIARLGRNYRSHRPIVEAAKQVIAPQTLVADRRLDAFLDGPHRVCIHRAAGERAEAEFVVAEIERMVGGTGFFSVDSGRADGGGEGYAFSDFAVLYRTEAQADALAEALARAGLPFQRRSHRRLLDGQAAQAIVAALAATDGSAPLVERVRQAAATARESLAAPEATVSEADLDEAADALRPLAARTGDLARFLAELPLLTEVDALDPRAARIALLTLHASKGLEYRAVFLTGCEDGLLPLRFSDEEVDLAEERRLFFVGMTRARDRLFLSWAAERRRHGRTNPSSPSPFLREIEERLLSRSSTPPRPRAPTQLTLW